MVRRYKIRFASCVFVIFVVCILSRDAYSGAAGTITLNKTADMFFGTVEYDATHSANVNLGTDGIVTLTAATGVAHDGNGNPATVTVTGSVADVIEVKCQNRLILRLGGKRINVRRTEVAIDTGVSFGNGGRCRGTGGGATPAAVVDLAVNPNPTVLIGGRAQIRNSNLDSGTYSSQNGGGRSMRLRVIYQ